ncbi:queuosine biosynthesis protein QueC [Elusimicrobium posterum]|uniref:7-cyano-7-deazaguanine synthase QueC n=1 Tax=Elusimicrobium posterum TaxID=3116653 RepID=UPI003C75F994
MSIRIANSREDCKTWEGNAVVIDVLRSATTLCALINRGKKDIRIYGDKNLAAAYKTDYPGVELYSELTFDPPVQKFDNSPYQASKSNADVAAALVTTAGTPAVLSLVKAKNIFMCGYCNINTLYNYLELQKEDILLVPSNIFGKGEDVEDSLLAEEFLQASISEVNFKEKAKEFKNTTRYKNFLKHGPKTADKDAKMALDVDGMKIIPIIRIFGDYAKVYTPLTLMQYEKDLQASKEVKPEIKDVTDVLPKQPAQAAAPAQQAPVSHTAPPQEQESSAPAHEIPFPNPGTVRPVAKQGTGSTKLFADLFKFTKGKSKIIVPSRNSQNSKIEEVSFPVNVHGKAEEVKSVPIVDEVPTSYTKPAQAEQQPEEKKETPKVVVEEVEQESNFYSTSHSTPAAETPAVENKVEEKKEAPAQEPAKQVEEQPQPVVEAQDPAPVQVEHPAQEQVQEVKQEEPAPVVEEEQKPGEKQKAVVLLSGGLDSTVCLYWAMKQGYDCYSLTIAYGQKHLKEITVARKIADAAGVKYNYVEVNLPWLADATSLVGKEEIPSNTKAEDIGKNIPSTYVPARNLVFVSLAASLADSVGATAIVLGPNAVDYSGYPDCTPEFYEPLEKAVQVGTRQGKQGGIKILTPIITMNKADIVKLGRELGAPLEQTWTCYNGGDKPCGVCESCILRKKGFEDAGEKETY